MARRHAVVTATEADPWPERCSEEVDLNVVDRSKAEALGDTASTARQHRRKRCLTRR